MKVEFTLGIGYAGARHKDIIEYDDDNITDEEIESDWRDWCDGYIDGGWEKIEE